MLSNIRAVQTLSRLHWVHPGKKKDVLILEFTNDTETIKVVFEIYYTTTILSDETVCNKWNFGKIFRQDKVSDTCLYSRRFA